MQEHNELVQTDSNETDTTRLQPMGFTDILDGMFSLYRSHFRLFVGIAVIYLVLEFGIDLISASFTTDPLSSTFSVIIGFSILATSIVSVLVTAGLVYASAHVYLGREITPRAAFQQAVRRFWPYLGSGILWFLAVVGLCITIFGIPVAILRLSGVEGLFIMIVGIGCAIVSIPFAIYFSIRWGLYTLPVLFEETTARNALRRSTELVKGTWWRVFGIMLAVSLISFMIYFILETSSGFLLSWIGVTEPEAVTDPLEALRQLFAPDLSEIGWFSYTVRRLVSLSLAALTMPIGVIGSTLLYFDLRIRKEAYDIEAQVTD